MTNASAETRLILLLLIVHGDRCGFVAQSKVVLADNQPQFTKNQINRGYEYLVDEGYLWEIKNITKCQKTNRRKSEPLYALTPSTFELWRQTLDSMLWKEDVLFLLRTLSNQLSSPKSQIGQKIDFLLVRIVLLVNANNARFVLSLENKSIGALLGLSEVRVRRALTELVKSQLIRVVAEDLADTRVFGNRSPIYWLQPFVPNRKTIDVGVNLQSELTPFRSINNLYQFHETMKKRPIQNRFKYSRQLSGLTDEMYFELAKEITQRRVATWLHYVCLSTVFSIVPWYAAFLSSVDSQQSNEKTTNPFASYDVLENKVYGILESALYTENFRLHESCHEDRQSSLNELTLMRKHILCSLTEELSNVICSLARHWRVLVNELGVQSARLIDFQPNGKMLVLSENSPKTESSVTNAHSTDEATHREILKIRCVITAYVPNDRKYNNCVIIDDELFMFGLSDPEKSIRRVIWFLPKVFQVKGTKKADD